MIYVAASQRGMSLSDLENIEVGQVIDFIIEYNNIMSGDDSDSEGKSVKRTRKAVQSDWNNF